jgi:hypothetical protein
VTIFTEVTVAPHGATWRHLCLDRKLTIVNIDMDEEEDSDDAYDISETNSIKINHQNILKQLRILRQIDFHKTILIIKQRILY